MTIAVEESDRLPLDLYLPIRAIVFDVE